jgi:hypothetical protein
VQTSATIGAYVGGGMLCRVFAFLCQLISVCCTKVRALADELAHRQ